MTGVEIVGANTGGLLVNEFKELLKQLKLDQNEEETLEHIILQSGKGTGLPRAAWRIWRFFLY